MHNLRSRSRRQFVQWAFSTVATYANLVHESLSARPPPPPSEAGVREVRLLLP